MHSKATPNSPFTAPLSIPRRNGKVTVKNRAGRFSHGAGSLIWKSILLLLLMFGIGARDSFAQSYITRVYAGSQNPVAGGLCVLCSVDNAASAADGNLSTASTINTTLGLLGATMSQDVIFTAGNGLPGSSTPAIVKIGIPSGLNSIVSANLLGGIYVQAYNGNTPVGNKVYASTAVLSLLASGNQAEVFLPAPGAAYDRVRVTYDSGLAGLLGSVNVYEAYFEKPATSTIPCDLPIDVLYGVTGLTLANLGSVTNPAQAGDGIVSPTNYATLSAVAGVLGSGAQVTAVFPGLSKAGDSVRVIMSNPSGLLTVQLLGNVTIKTYNHNVLVDSMNISTGMLRLDLLPGGTNLQAVTFQASAPFDHVEVIIGGGVASLLTTVRVHEIQRFGPGPTLTNPALVQTTCLGSPLTLSLSNTDPSLVYNWYNNITQTTPIATGTSFNAPATTTGSTTYYVASTRPGCTTESARTPVTVLVNNYATAADVNATASATQICSGDTVSLTPSSTTANIQPVFSWYLDNNKVSAIRNGLDSNGVKYTINPTTGKLFIVGLAAGTYTYYVSVHDSLHCENQAGALKAVAVTVGAKPAPAVVTGAFTVGTGQQVTLTAQAVPGSNILWYTDTAAAPISTGPATFVVGPFATPGTYTYYAGVQAVGGGCVSNRVPVVITVTGAVTPGADCNIPTTQASGTTLGCVLCSVTNPTFDIDADTTNFTTLNIPVGLLGGSVYQQLGFPKRGQATDSLRLKLGFPTGLVDVSLLGGTVVTVLNGATVVSQTTLSNLTIRLLSGSRFIATVPTGAAYDRVEIRLTGVANLLTSLNIYGVRAVGANPTISSSNITVCQGMPAVLSATPAANTTLQWFLDSTSTTPVSTQATFTTDSLKIPGTFKYFVQVVDSGCANPERIPVTVNVTALGTPADITLADTTVACSNTTTVLTPTAAGVTNPVFKWYADANKNTPITNGAVIGGATFTIDASGKLSVTGLSTGNHTYYVSVSGSNRCENAAGSLKAATIKVGTSAAPPAAVLSYSISTGLPLTMTASPAAGAIVVWYTDTTKASIATGNSFTLPPFTNPGTYTYFVGDSIPGGCVSNRLQITVTVNGPVIPTSCNVPTSQTTGTTLGCVLCSVVNPTNDIDADTSNFTRLNIPVGLLGGSVYQQLVFPAVGAGTDSIRLNMASPTGLADVSLLGGAVVTVYNGTTQVSQTTLSNLLTIRLLNSNRFVATVPTGAPYDRVEVRLTGVANLLNSLDIYGVRAVAPDPTVSVQSGTACAGSKATLTATPATGTTVRWYADSTTAVVLSTSNTFTTDTLKTAGNVTYYVQAVDANGCANPNRIPVTVTVNPLGQPSNINIADTTTACTSTPAVLAPTATGVTNPVFKWYLDANKATQITDGMVNGSVKYAIDATSGKLTVTGLAAGMYTYYVSVSGSNICENPAGALKAAKVNVVTAPAPPVVTGDVVVQTGAKATLTANPVPGANIVWYSDSTTIAGTGATIQVGPFNAPGTYTYFAVVQIPGACQSARVPVNVVVTGTPIPPTDCNVPTTQASGTTLGCVLCSVQNPTNDIDNNPANATTLSIPVGVLGGSVYQQLIFPTPGAAGDSIQLRLGNSVGLADVSLLGGTLVSLYNNNTLVKSDTLSNLLTLRLLNGQQFTATVAAPAAYDRVEVRLKGVVNLLNSLDIYGARILYPTPTVNTNNATTCINTKTTLSVTPAAGTSVRWYADSTGTTVLGNQNTYTTDTLKVAGTVTYYVAVVGGPNNCPNPTRIPVTVTVTPAPPVPGAPATVNVCPGSDVALQPTAANHQFTYRWYTVATGGTALNTDSGYVFNLKAVMRDTTFYVEAVSSCGATSPRQTISVVMSSSLSAPVVTPNPARVTKGTQAVLNASSNTANVIFKWYGSQTGTDSLNTGPVFAPPITAVDSVTYWVEASLSGGGTCKSIRVPATVIYGAAPPFIPVPCEGATSQTVGSSGLLVLGDVYNRALAVDNDASTASALVMNVGALNAQIWQRAMFNGVSTLGDTVRVLLSNPSQVLSASLLGSVQLTTYNGTVPGDSMAVNSQLLKLTLLNNNSQALVEFVPTKLFDAVEVKLKSGIVGALTEIDFNYAQRALVAPTVQAAQVNICAGNTATLQVQNPAAGVTYRWYNSNGTYITGKDGATYVTNTLSADTTFFVEAFRNGCASTSRTRVNVKVLAAPVAPAVQAASVGVCAGSDARLAVANPVSGYTYGWYNVATGGTRLNPAPDSGLVFNVKNVTAQATYYVEAINDSCKTVSVTRTAVTVNTVTALPVPTVTPMNDTVVVGQNPVFTASATTANAQFYWFRTQTATDTLFKGAQFKADAPTALGTTTYWVEAAIPGSGSCTSARVAVNVIAVTPGPGIVPCEGATGQTIGGSGLLVLGNVYNPQLAVDQYVSTASSLVMNLGVLNANIWQRLTFNGLSAPGDTVKVMVSNPSQILSAAALASVQLTSYNGNTPGDSVLVSNPVLNVNILSGGRSAILSFVPTKPFDGVEVKLKAGLAAALTEVDINYAQRALVQPTIQVTTATACKGSQAVLNVVNPAPGVVYSWYNSKGNHLLDSVAFVTPTTLDSGTYAYTVRASRNQCQSVASQPATVTILGTPAVPVPMNGDTATTCVNNTVTLKVQPVAGVQFNWYDAAIGGAKLATNTNQYTTPATLAVGTYNFYIEAVNAGNCVSDSGRLRMTVMISNGATAADIQAADQTICQGDTARVTPTSTTVQNPVFKWYANADRTGPITQGVSSTGVLTLTGLTPGAYTYYVSVSSGGNCENKPGDLKAVKITVNNTSVATDIIARDTTTCPNNTVQLSVSSNTVTNPVFKWYADAALTKYLATGATYTTPALTATTSYFVTVEGSNSCANKAGSAKEVKVNIATVPEPIINASAISICVGDTTTLTVQNADNSITYKWYNTATGGTAVFTGPVYQVTGLTTSTDFYAEASISGCTSATRTKVSIGVGVAPTPILESNNVTACQGGTAVLKVTSSTANITYKWYTTPTGGTAVFTGPIFTVQNVTANGSYYVEASGDTSKCGKPSARAQAKITVVPVPAAPSLVSSNVSVCKGQSVALQIQNPAAGYTYEWFDAATGGNQVNSGTTFNIAAADSSATYYVQATLNGGCSSASRTAATVTVTVVPPVPQISASTVSICAGGTVTLSVNNPVAGATYRWFDAPVNGTLLATANTYTTAPLAANTDFYLEAGNGVCSNPVRTKVTIGVGQAPVPVLESNTLTVCQGSTATLRVTSATNGIIYKWYTSAAGNDSVGVGSTFTTAPLNASTDFYVAAVGSNTSCGAPSARVKASVTVTTPPAAPDVVAGALRTCAGTGVTVAVKTIVPGLTYQWYDAATGGTLLSSNAVYNVPVVSQTTTFYVQSNQGQCSSTRTAVTVNVDPTPTMPSVISGNQTTCVGGTLTFAVSNPDASLTYRWYDAQTNGNLLANGTSYATTPLAANTTFYVEALNSQGCASARLAVNAIVKNQIDPPLVDPITLCSSYSGVLSVKNKQAGLVYNWYTAATGGTPVFTGGDFTITPTAGTVYYVESSTGAGCVSASRTMVVVTVNPSPAAPAVSSAGIGVCTGSTATLNVLNPDATLTYAWYTTATGGTAVSTGTTYTTPAITANQMYYVEASNSFGCASPTRTAISVQLTQPPAAPVVTGNTEICPGKTTTLTATSATAGTILNWYSVATGGTPIYTGSPFVTPALSANTTYYVEAVTKDGCAGAGGRTRVDITMAQQLPAPVVTTDNTTPTSITFRWTPVPGAQAYQVTIDNGVTFIVPSSGANGITHTISGLQANQSVTIQVRAVGATDCQTSALSTAVTDKTKNPNGNNIFVPNIFSPNGDGVNDVLYVYGTAIAKLEFWVYNQWGQLAFYSKDQRQGWDGTMSGQKQPLGVYVYIVKAVMQDGSTVYKRGNVTLMR